MHWKPSENIHQHSKCTENRLRTFINTLSALNTVWEHSSTVESECTKHCRGTVIRSLLKVHYIVREHSSTVYSELATLSEEFIDTPSALNIVREHSSTVCSKCTTLSENIHQQSTLSALNYQIIFFNSISEYTKHCQRTFINSLLWDPLHCQRTFINNLLKVHQTLSKNLILMTSL